MAKNEMLDYGFNVIIKEYARFPKFLSLPCHWEHGWTASSLPLNTDLATSKSFMLVFSKRREQAWKQKSNIPVAIMGAPFVHYRRMRNIKKDDDAKGTIAFPSHSCKGVLAKFEIDKYCQELRNLPDIFKPVTICLHIDDINNGIQEKFKEQGFNVVTAGNQFSPDFPARFYNILRSHNFSTSNTIGSYTFYAVEMDIPFFISGDLSYWENYGDDPNVPKIYSITDYPIGKYTYDIFNNGPTTVITNQQKQFIIDEIGLNDCLSRQGMKKMLWTHKIIGPIEKLKRKPNKAFKLFYLIYKEALRITQKTYLLKYGLIEDNKIFTHMTINEKIELHKTIIDYFDKRRLVCVEIGSYLGASSCFIANAISSDSVLYCIDTWQNDAMRYDDNDIDADPRDTYEEFKINTKKYSKKILIIRKLSHEAVSEIKQKIDLLLIDGDHSYEAVKLDWGKYSVLLKVGSIVIFHDTGWADGVKKVINESLIEKAIKLFELPNMQGYRIVNLEARI